MANRLQDSSLLLNTCFIYDNRITAGINTSPSALFITPSLLLHAAQQPAPSQHGKPPARPECQSASALHPAHRQSSKDSTQHLSYAPSLRPPSHLLAHRPLGGILPQGRWWNILVASVKGSCQRRGLIPSHPRHVVRRSEHRAKKDPGPEVQLCPPDVTMQPWPGSRAFWQCVLPLAGLLHPDTPLPTMG